MLNLSENSLHPLLLQDIGKPQPHQNFLNLQAQLEGTENRIAVARADYIKAVERYNLELRTIPGKWVAAIFYPDAHVKQNFTATPAETAVPKVSFGK